MAVSPTSGRSALPTPSPAKTPEPTATPGLKSAQELPSGDKFTLGLNGKTGQKDVEAALSQIMDPATAKEYADFGHKLGASQAPMLKGVETKMGEWLKANPRATSAEVAAKAKEIVSTQCMIQKTYQDMAMKMASAAIDRMKDTFEG